MESVRTSASAGARTALAAALAGVAYVVAGLLAMAAYPIDQGMAGIWPGAGIAVAAVLLAGPLAAVGIFFGDALLGLHAGLGIVPAAILALGIVGESLSAWYLLTRAFQLGRRLETIRDVALFIALGVVPSALLCVMLRISLLTFLGQDLVRPGGWALGFFAGFLGHGLGVLIVAPVLLTWRVRRTAAANRGELWCLIVGSLLLNSLAFSATPIAPGAALLIASFVAVLWAALRFGVRETSIVMLITSIFATVAAGRRIGPFLFASPSEGLLSLSLLLLVAGVTALFLAAAGSERRCYLRRVVDSEATHRSLVEQMAEGLARLDRHGTVNYASDRFCAIFGRPREAIVGRRLDSLVADRDRRPLVAAIESSRRDGAAQTDATVAVGTGEARHVAVNLRAVVDDGAAAGTMAVVSDVTERRLAEAQAQLRLEQLAHMNRLASMDEMATAFAHEVAQPITAVTNYLRAAQRFAASEPPDAKGAAEALSGAERESRRSAEILRRIRAFVQNRTHDPTEVDARALIDEVIQLASPYARAHAAALVADGGSDGARVVADSIEIQQVLINLVRNAVEAVASRPDGERRVAIGARRDDGSTLCISVRDTGPGVRPDVRDRIFSPFFSTKANGVGIGLALCRSIVETHGGRLWLEDSPAGGATFTFSLPRVAGEAAAVSAPARPPEASARPPAGMSSRSDRRGVQ